MGRQGLDAHLTLAYAMKKLYNWKDETFKDVLTLSVCKQFPYALTWHLMYQLMNSVTAYTIGVQESS